MQHTCVHGSMHPTLFRLLSCLLLLTAPACRREAYTCWNQASSARVNNYGTRIDLILLADAVRQHAGRRPFEACWVASDIEPGRQGSDHAPVWADLEPHQPLVIAAAPPPLASRFLFAGVLDSKALEVSSCYAVA